MLVELSTITRVLGLTAAGAVLALAAGGWLWERSARKVGARLDAQRLKPVSKLVSFNDFKGLPDPVERYFRTVLTDGQPVVASARIFHRGQFNMSETGERWKPFTSEQAVTTARPGFDWEARISMAPGLSVFVRDAYVGGQGILKASLAGLYTVAELPGSPELAYGELMRFLAEAVWYPTALLPGPFVKWEERDGTSAKATLADGGTAVSLVFHFGPDGLVERVWAESRPRTVGEHTVNMPWEGRFQAWEKHGGMLVPAGGEVAWITPEGPQAYWRGKAERIEYAFAGGHALEKPGC
jgi:hypothetical protein